MKRSNRRILTISLLLLLAPAACTRRKEEPAKALPRTTTQTGITMVRIPAGTFTMGDAGGEDDEKPAHAVTLQPFYMDIHEVTQESFQALMGKNPAKFKEAGRPVERVSWVSAAQYCNMRSLREGFKPCYDADTLTCDFSADGYRLPTEAEWEYACRAQTETAYSFGAGAAELQDHAWYKKNAGGTTHPVGQKAPNPWSLHDMHGNVWEWCHDYYSGTAYESHEARDPGGPTQGEERVLRGGSWQSTPESCRSAVRYSETPAFADACFGTEAYGFRCVRRAKTSPAS